MVADEKERSGVRGGSSVCIHGKRVPGSEYGKF